MNICSGRPLMLGIALALAIPLVGAETEVRQTQVLPPDPKHVLNRMMAIKAPATAPAGQTLSIGYWSYQIYGQYCVEPKVYTCGKTNVAMSWMASTPPTLELISANGAIVQSYALPAVLPAALLNYKGNPQTLGTGLSAGSLVQWCTSANSWPVWKLKLGNSATKIEWNPNPNKRKTISLLESSC